MLRNKQFLYYNGVFGNRSIRKGYQKASVLNKTVNGEEEFSERNRTNDNHTPVPGAKDSSMKMQNLEATKMNVINYFVALEMEMKMSVVMHIIQRWEIGQRI